MSDEYTSIRIYVTINYEQFKFLEENRDVKGNTVLNSIRKKDLLIDNPILVSANMEVLDGQNRLIAAKVLKVPIYYKFAQATTRQDIALLQNHTGWVIKDHAHFFEKVSSEQNEDYRFINEMARKHEMPLHFIISCVDPSKDAYRKFKNGELVIKDNLEQLKKQFEKLAELLEIIKALITTCKKKTAITHKFKRMLWAFMKTKGYSQKRMIEAFHTYSENLMKLLVYNSEPIIFKGLRNDVYNYNLKKKGNRLPDLD